MIKFSELDENAFLLSVLEDGVEPIRGCSCQVNMSP